MPLALIIVSSIGLIGCYEDEDDDDSSSTPKPTATPYPDADDDGFRADEDCDDGDAEINPDATEVCDGLDNNCSDGIDEGLAQVWYEDADQDGYGGDTVNNTDCAQPSGYVVESGDCDDEDPLTYPGADDICDEKDNDCDDGLEGGGVDEDPDLIFYADGDGDGFGDLEQPVLICSAGTGYSDNGQDCDDANGAVSPGAMEVADNGSDENCDGLDRHVDIYVTKDGISHVPGAAVFSSIQGAIDAALTGHTIAVGPGVYDEKVSFKGKNLYLVSMYGPEATIVDGGGEEDSPDEIDSVFFFGNGEGNEAPAVVKGFTITGGRGTDGGTCGFAPFNRYGGAVCATGSAPTIEGNIIEDNSVPGSGGALYLKEGDADVIDNIIRRNESNYDGAAVNLSSASGDVVGNVIVDNHCARWGAGIYVLESSGLIANNIIAFNKLDDTAVKSGAGAGIYLQDAYPRIYNNIIANNQAIPDGGGVFGFNVQSGGELVNNTIVGNSALQDGGGIRITGGQFTLINNIVAFNTAASGANVSNSENDLMVTSYNIFWTPDGAASGGTVGATLGATDMVSNPGFVDDPTDLNVNDDNYQLKDGSSAINAGDPAGNYNDVNGTRNDLGAFGGPRGDELPYATMAEVVEWLE